MLVFHCISSMVRICSECRSSARDRTSQKQKTEVEVSETIWMTSHCANKKIDIMAPISFAPAVVKVIFFRDVRAYRSLQTTHKSLKDPLFDTSVVGGSRRETVFFLDRAPDPPSRWATVAGIAFWVDEEVHIYAVFFTHSRGR